MKLHLRDFANEGRNFLFTEKESWLARCVEALDESSSSETFKQRMKKLGAPLRSAETKRKIVAELFTQRLDSIYLLRGNIRTEIRLICSRCTNELWQKCSPEFTLAFSQDKKQADETDQDEITLLTQHYIELDIILTEQLRLALPFHPLCRESCKGICQKCGADLNAEKCVCSKLSTNEPFSVLKDYRVKAKGDS